jgi:hypothetical protein
LLRNVHSHGVGELEEILATDDSVHCNPSGWPQMIPGRALSSLLWCTVFGGSLLSAADFSTYRGFQFGMSVADAAERAGMKATDAKTAHQRPALIQVLDFQPNLFHSSAAQNDPVSEISLTFFNGELARMAVLYDRYKVDGMTSDDIVEAISAIYGPATKPGTEVLYHSYYSEVSPVLARWENQEYCYNLIRANDRSSFAMVLYSKRLDGLAQSAIVEAVRLDAQEAPERETARAKQQEADNRAQQEKARTLNKSSFRP